MTSIPRTSEVLVLGGGFAGLSTAIRLADRGIPTRVLSIDRSAKGRLGETFAPNACVLLQELGVWNEFVADGHLECYANRSVWGQSEPYTFDFINHPHGHAWHVDRARLGERLTQRAITSGVAMEMAPKLVGAGRIDGVWSVDTADATWRAPWLVDATGRSGWLSRRMSGQRHAVDRQVAVAASCTLRPGAVWDPMSLVETTPFGWWYSAPSPDNRMALLFFTDVDLRHSQHADWQTWVDHAPYTHARASEALSAPMPSRTFPASSERSAAFGGGGWLAVGDAAFCVDPLSSHGIMIALRSGIDAADAIAHGSVDQYVSTMELVWEHIREQTQMHYRRERRWSEYPYWQRRISVSLYPE